MIWHYKYYTRFTNSLYNEYDSKITMKEINLPYPIIHHQKKKKKKNHKKNCSQALFEGKALFISISSIQLDEQ